LPTFVLLITFLHSLVLVIPAKAGIQCFPLFALRSSFPRKLESSFRSLLLTSFPRLHAPERARTAEPARRASARMARVKRESILSWARHPSESWDSDLVLQSSSKNKASTRPAAERVTFFACAKKVTEETHPGRRALRTSLCSGCAKALRRFADCTSLSTAANDRASCAVPCGLSPPRLRRALRGPGWAASCRRSQERKHLDGISA